MRTLVVFTIFMMTFLVVETKRPKMTSAFEEKNPKEIRIKNLEKDKAEIIHKHYKDRYENLKGIHNHNNKDVKEAELKLGLSRIDLEIAKIKSE